MVHIFNFVIEFTTKELLFCFTKKNFSVQELHQEPFKKSDLAAVLRCSQVIKSVQLSQQSFCYFNFSVGQLLSYSYVMVLFFDVALLLLSN